MVFNCRFLGVVCALYIIISTCSGEMRFHYYLYIGAFCELLHLVLLSLFEVPLKPCLDQLMYLTLIKVVSSNLWEYFVFFFVFFSYSFVLLSPYSNFSNNVYFFLISLYYFSFLIFLRLSIFFSFHPLSYSFWYYIFRFNFFYVHLQLFLFFFCLILFGSSFFIF